MEIFELTVNERKTTGKGTARTLRREGMIPAVLYGPKTPSKLLTVSVADLNEIYKQSDSEHLVLNLTIKNGGTEKKTAMVKEMQTSPVSSQFLHVDFYEISLDEKIVVKVPVELTGKSKGVERGGFLQLVRHQLEVSCLPTDIPANIEIDVTDLDIGDSLHIEEISASKEVELLYDVNFTVVTVVAPSIEEEEVPEEELEEEVEEAAETTEEPAEQ